MSKEQAVRSAAATLYDAIVSAEAAGLHVEWPRRADGLPAIAVSETRKTVAAVTVDAPAGTDPVLATRAAGAAQRAADRVIDPPAKK